MGWEQLSAMARAAGERRARDEAGPPTNCPNDGTALEITNEGKYRCPFDGWTWHNEPVTW